MTFEYMDELERAVIALRDDREARAVVITAAGEEQFSVGMDLEQLDKPLIATMFGYEPAARRRSTGPPRSPSASSTSSTPSQNSKQERSSSPRNSWRSHRSPSPASCAPWSVPNTYRSRKRCASNATPSADAAARQTGSKGRPRLASRVDCRDGARLSGPRQERTTRTRIRECAGRRCFGPRRSAGSPRSPRRSCRSSSRGATALRGVRARSRRRRGSGSHPRSP